MCSVFQFNLAATTVIKGILTVLLNY